MNDEDNPRLAMFVRVFDEAPWPVWDPAGTPLPDEAEWRSLARGDVAALQFALSVLCRSKPGLLETAGDLLEEPLEGGGSRYDELLGLITRRAERFGAYSEMLSGAVARLQAAGAKLATPVVEVR